MNKAFSELFCEYPCRCEALRSAEVTGVRLERERHLLEVWLSCGSYLDKLEELRQKEGKGAVNEHLLRNKIAYSLKKGRQ